MQKEVGKCCNCNKTTWAKNKYGYECLVCRCSRIATMKQLNNNITLSDERSE